jgi:hypothetical protein
MDFDQLLDLEIGLMIIHQMAPECTIFNDYFQNFPGVGACPWTPLEESRLWRSI